MVAVPGNEFVPRSPRTMLREWITEQIEGDDAEVSAVGLLPLAEERFANDSEFRAALFRLALVELLPDVLRQLLNGKRGYARLGAVYVASAEMNKLVMKRLRSWYENGHNSTHVPLLRMTCDDFDYALEQRRAQVQGHLTAIAFLEELRSGLPTGTTVSEFYVESDLARIYARHYGKKGGSDGS